MTKLKKSYKFAKKIIPLQKKYTLIPEAQLLTMLKQRDNNAFEYLYQHYSRALYGIVLGVVRQEELAQEVLQDCFVKIWQKISYYDSSKGSLFTWMLNISKNTAIDKVRSKEYKQMVSSNRLEMVDDDKNLKNSEKMQTDFIGISSIVQQLPEDLNEIIDLCYMQGYTHQEMGEMLKLPLGTVKTKIRIALRELRKLVGFI